MIKPYYIIFFFIFIKSQGSDQLIIFNPYSVGKYNVNGIATFLNNFNIKKGEITISGDCGINNNEFFDNQNNQITINSNNFIIEELLLANLGQNYLAIDENNNLSILKNTPLLDKSLANDYNIIYTSNIIGKDNMPLKIGNKSTSQFFIGDYTQKTSNIIFNSYETMINNLDTIDNKPITILKPFISYNNLQVDTDVSILSNVLVEKTQINKTLIINDPIYFTEMIINGNCSINNNNNSITILPKNGILNVKNNILIKGLPLYNNTKNTFTLFALDKNKNIYKTALKDLNAINAINQDLFFIANNIITIGSDFSNIELNANLIILDTMTVHSNKPAIKFDFPISFQAITPNTLSQLIFQDTLTINNIVTINNLFSAVNNNSIANINMADAQQNTIFNSDQIVFLNYNTMDIYQGPRLVIDKNNCIGIEGLNNTNSEYLRIHKDIKNKINIIEQRITKINKNIITLQKTLSKILEQEKQEKLFRNCMISEINSFLEN